MENRKSRGLGESSSASSMAEGKASAIAVCVDVIERAVYEEGRAKSSSIEALMPVIALQGPVQHHEALWQSAVGHSFFEAEVGGAPMKWAPWNCINMVLNQLPMQLPHHHPGG